jgi:hypothetical protein
MFIDGVLRSSTGAPIYQGLGIYKLLQEANKIYIFSNDVAKDERWLRENKLWSNTDDLIGPNVVPIGEDVSFGQVMHCRTLGGSFEMAITSDPELAAKLLEKGVTTLMMLHPLYIDERHRPDGRKGVKSWNDIKAEIEKQQDQLAEDRRIKDVE